MLECATTTATLLVHDLVEAGPVPTCLDRDGVYPYSSFVETSLRPRLKDYPCNVLENDHIRAVVCPGLGGKLLSLIEKSSGRESLFREPVVRPVRYLPRQAFLSGGIETSFPISHTPSQVESLHSQSRIMAGRAYCWCGERELRFGMRYTIEFSLASDDRFLTQRMRIDNPTPSAHPWMSWSNAAAAALPDTEFHFPSGLVLAHGSSVEIIDWDAAGPRRQSDVARMRGYFWKNPDVHAFGVFTPSLGTGLYHVAHPSDMPGIKLWTYGEGDDRRWSHGSTLSKQTYLEIQAGPLADQSEKTYLKPDGSRCWTEYWIPASTPLDIRQISIPEVSLCLPREMPVFDWRTGQAIDPWLALLDAWRSSDKRAIPDIPAALDGIWAPSGMDDLGPALAWAIERNPACADRYAFHCAAWHAGRDCVAEAHQMLQDRTSDACLMLSAVLLRRCGDSHAAARAFRRISNTSLSLHPQVTVERDLALAALGTVSLKERGEWLARSAALADEWLAERRADHALASGDPAQAIAILRSTRFQQVHQRYARTELWNSAMALLGCGDPTPPSLGEDDHCVWGSYREYDSDSRPSSCKAELLLGNCLSGDGL
jgi:hypothetical protein